MSESLKGLPWTLLPPLLSLFGRVATVSYPFPLRADQTGTVVRDAVLFFQNYCICAVDFLPLLSFFCIMIKHVYLPFSSTVVRGPIEIEQHENGELPFLTRMWSSCRRRLVSL